MTILLVTTGCSFASYLADIPSHEPFCFARVSATVVENVIMSLKNKRNKSDTYSVEVSMTIEYLVSPLSAHIINLSLPTGCFPNYFKKSRVVPIYKFEIKTDANNYRPVSILPTLSKIFEKLVYIQLLSYSHHFKLLSANQFGFRKKCFNF